jgi:pimeloyl-ACP methyl ester carboxylesterase
MPALVAGGHRLEYRWLPATRDDVPPLVFLHEGLGSAELWRDFPDALAGRTGRAALIYSRYGYGRSDPIVGPRGPDYLEREALDTLPEVLACQGIERPVLVGHSDGATIALIYAAAHPAAVSALLLEAPHVFVEDVTVKGIEVAQAAFVAGRLRERLAPYHTDVDATFRGWADAWTDPRFRALDVTRSLPAIRAPVLVIQGEQDQYGTAAQVEAIRRGVTGRVEVHLLPACGHAPHVEQRDVVLDTMERFLAPLGSGPGPAN